MTFNIDESRLSQAEAWLWSYAITRPADIDLEAIAFDNGAEVRYRALDGCDGRLVGADGRAVITVSTRSNPQRQRFTLAHELAHWRLHRGQQAFLCAKEDIAPQNAGAKTLETVANDFASQLVLPSYLFDPLARDQRFRLDSVSHLADTFKASFTATTIKFVKASVRPVLAVCYSQSKREWFAKSAKLPREFWVRDEVDPDSGAFALLYGAGSAAQGSQVTQERAALWFSDAFSADKFVHVESIQIPSGKVLSLVTLI